jgi:general secretion pathway protein G
VCSGSKRRRRGFTLIELLVVILIVATLASVVAPSLLSNVGDARQTAGHAQLDVLSMALDAYRLDVGEYPTQSEGLTPLRTMPSDATKARRWRGPYLRQEVPLDPWGRPWIYRVPGRANPRSFDLYSLGKDEALGGEGENADLTAWRGPVQP